MTVVFNWNRPPYVARVLRSRREREQRADACAFSGLNRTSSRLQRRSSVAATSCARVTKRRWSKSHLCLKGRVQWSIEWLSSRFNENVSLEVPLGWQTEPTTQFVETWEPQQGCLVKWVLVWKLGTGSFLFSRDFGKMFVILVTVIGRACKMRSFPGFFQILTVALPKST